MYYVALSFSHMSLYILSIVLPRSEQHIDSADDLLPVILIFFVQQVITVMNDRDVGTVMK